MRSAAGMYKGGRLSTNKGDTLARSKALQALGKLQVIY